MTFGEALEAIKIGKMVRRRFWDLAYLYLNHNRIYIDESPYECKGQLWKAHHDDLLCNDWEIVS